MPRVTNTTTKQTFRANTVGTNILSVPDWATGVIVQCTTGDGLRLTWADDSDPVPAGLGFYLKSTDGPIRLDGRSVVTTLRVIDNSAASDLMYSFVSS